MGGDHLCLCGMLYKDYQDDIVPVGIAMLAQMMFGWIYYGMIVVAPWVRAMAVDKGVKQFEYMKFRHAMSLCLGSSAISGIVRAFAILGVMKLAGVEASLCMYSQAGLFAWGITLAAMHNAIWSQRPWSLIIIDAVSEGLNYMVAALALFNVKH